MRKLITKVLPEPAPEENLPRSIVKQISDTPQFTAVRLFWDNLNELRPWWPILLPLLLWVGWRKYQHERQSIQQSELSDLS